MFFSFVFQCKKFIDFIKIIVENKNKKRVHLKILYNKNIY